ncbi:SDR family NAD(P)-dependent oxidoreductase [Amycolatopsis rhabdoformis]|uniref:SDR family NAD(P)-dependent oxidoreductase n=1 Tax=Amycolatopsis rhabdoformis TaxID=1448059 RepID=A0ABZ1I6D2_9PSEU|nr:SDR family NAD(P)-dependent oxidoreductase [Amycolatopsis rhabdoformis]WSE29387.1 SDR family NAD(P)-dependent oxidoreductase [Amycolatopsis rhabdoformis]
MTQSIVVFGAGPGVGRALARRYGKAGYDVVLVARRAAPLEEFASALATDGTKAHVLPADLSETSRIPALATRIRALVGDPAVVYYAPSPADPDFIPAVSLTAARLHELMPLTLDSLIAVVGEFLPAMLGRGDGAILTAQGAAAVTGRAGMSGWPPLLAAQRNYLQALAAEVADRGVFVGQLHIGARITGTPFDEHYRASGRPDAAFPAADPADLADLLWTMHADRRPLEKVVPDRW